MELYDYQQLGSNFIYDNLKSNRGVLLADQMGKYDKFKNKKL